MLQRFRSVILLFPAVAMSLLGDMAMDQMRWECWMEVPVCWWVVVSQSESDVLAEAAMTVLLHASAMHVGLLSL